MRIPLALAAAAALLLAAPAGAQEQPRPPSRVDVVGRVTDASTGAPVAGAAVRIADQRRAVVTDSAGRFTLSRLRPGDHRVVVSRLGYTSMIQTVTAGAEGTPLEVEVIPQPLVMEGLAVVTDWLEERRRGVPVPVRTVGAAEIQGTGASRVSHVVQRYASFTSCASARNVAPGTRGHFTARPRPDFMNPRFGAGLVGSGGDHFGITGGSCVVRRGNTYLARVVIDEIPVFGGMGELDSYTPQDIHLIEVYAGGTMVRAYTNAYIERLATDGGLLDPIIQ